jgi:paraquat-inducible protein A
LSGVAFLYTSGSWPLALIVLVASVMIPLGKLAALAYCSSRSNADPSPTNREGECSASRIHWLPPSYF